MGVIDDGGIEDDGWDTRARLVGEWVERYPRRAEVVGQLRVEVRLLPWLAPQVPLEVPLPHVLSEDPFAVRHRLVPGDRVRTPGAAQGRQLGAFLRALHATDTAAAVAHGVPSGRDSEEQRVRMVHGFRTRVLPLLPADRREDAAEALAGVTGAPADRLVHADIGPAHLLERDGALTGVLDFGDAHVGDPAEDLGWALNAAPQEFADAVADSYGVTPEIRERALMWHRLGAWMEADFGLHTDAPDLVRSGIEGILRRSRTPGSGRSPR